MKRPSLLLAVAVVLVSNLTAASGPTSPFLVIVNEKNPVRSLTRAQVASLMLKKTTNWEHGGRVQPVDQSEDSAARKAFSDAVLKKSPAAVRSYWQQAIFSGRDIPPPEKGSD